MFNKSFKVFIIVLALSLLCTNAQAASNKSAMPTDKAILEAVAKLYSIIDMWSRDLSLIGKRKDINNDYLLIIHYKQEDHILHNPPMLIKLDTGKWVVGNDKGFEEVK